MIDMGGDGKHRCDIVTDRVFDDFELYYEYRISRGGNSGVYLRGRYEIQIMDDFSAAPTPKDGNGALYGVAAPPRNVSRPAGHWQSVRVKMIGDTVTVVLNGVKVIEQARVTSPTGWELDRNTGTPGPIMLQGYIGSVQFRNLMIRPIRRG
jgi:hypothetical protein